MVPSAKKLWQMYSIEEKSLNEISKITGLSTIDIRKKLVLSYEKEYKILAKTRKSGRGKEKSKFYNNGKLLNPDEIWRLYAAEGYTIIKIALHFSVSEFVIRKILLKNPNYR